MAHTITASKAVALRLIAWRRDPALFCRQVLGFTPWECDDMVSQADVLRACAWYERVTTRSGHKVGKSKLGAALALWEFICWPGSRTILTAPSARQVKRVLWREVGIMWRVARKRLRAFGIDTAGELAIDPGTGLIDRVTGSEILGFTTNDPDKFSGISNSGRVTYIVDEASGVAESIFQAIKGNMAGGARLIMFSNPTQPNGTFYDSHHDASELYRTFHLDSAAVAIALSKGNIQGVSEEDMAGLARLGWVGDMLVEFGAQSAEYDVRVRGNFAAQGADGIVPLGLVQKAQAIWHSSNEVANIGQRLFLGLDVARFGDDESVIIGRRGQHVIEPVSWRNMDSIQLAAAAVAQVNDWSRHGEGLFRPKPMMMVDVGGPGAGVYDQLVDKYADEVEVVPVDFGGRADDARLHMNKRTQIWFGIRGFLKRGGTLPRHRELRADVTSVRYSYDKDNRYIAEPKKNVKKRLGRSPDYGDAMALCVYEPGVTAFGTVNVTGL